MVSTSLLPRARALSPGETLTLSAQDWVRVPPGFSKTALSRPGAATYREDRPTRPLVVRRSADRVVVRRDRYHPRYHPLKHLVYDALPDSVVAGAGRVGTALGRTG